MSRCGTVLGAEMQCRRRSETTVGSYHKNCDRLVSMEYALLLRRNEFQTTDSCRMGQIQGRADRPRLIFTTRGDRCDVLGGPFRP